MKLRSIFLLLSLTFFVNHITSGQQISYARSSGQCLFALIDKKGKIVKTSSGPRIKIADCTDGAKSKPPKSWPIEPAGAWQVIGSPAEAVNTCECKDGTGKIKVTYDLNDMERLNYACQQRCNTELCANFARKSCKKTTTTAKIAESSRKAKLEEEKKLAAKKAALEKDSSEKKVAKDRADAEAAAKKQLLQRPGGQAILKCQEQIAQKLNTKLESTIKYDAAFTCVPEACQKSYEDDYTKLKNRFASLDNDTKRNTEGLQESESIAAATDVSQMFRDLLSKNEKQIRELLGLIKIEFPKITANNHIAYGNALRNELKLPKYESNIKEFIINRLKQCIAQKFTAPKS